MDEEQYRQGLLNAVAHELSTPLTPIRLQLFLLHKQMEGLDPRTQDALRVIDRNVERLHRLIQDVLEVSRLESHAFPVRMEGVDLADLAREACQEYQGPAKEAGLRLGHDLQAAHLMGDRERLTQVLHHLLRNAIRHTPEPGEVVVTVQEDQGEAVLQVRDTGVGFPPEDAPRLFQPFSQVTSTRTDVREGSGLGLYISRGIAELHGGTMGAHSPGPHDGAVFTVRLPARGGQAENMKERQQGFDRRIRELL